MTPEARKEREDQIAEAAYKLLETRGYEGVSMLNIAKAAKASNETLYRWYGDKAGLFLALVERNAQEARDLLTDESSGDLLEVLRQLGPVLLKIVTGPRAVALNRAAAGDPSGRLGRAIAIGGREAILPRLRSALSGQVRADDLDAAAADFANLLIGDLQIRRVIGVLEPLDETARQQRADRAIELFSRLYGLDQQ